MEQNLRSSGSLLELFALSFLNFEFGKPLKSNDSGASNSSRQIIQAIKYFNHNCSNQLRFQRTTMV
jgi:hypothetical protein